MNISYFGTLTLSVVFFIGLVLLPNGLIAQTGGVLEDDKSGNSREFWLTSGIVASSGSSLPFWFYTNRSGRIDRNGSQWLMEIEYREKYIERDHFQLSGGFLATGRVAQSERNSSFFFPEAYLEFNYRFLRLRGGRYRDFIGLNNSDLSIGSMMVSRNATPLPRITIDTGGFTELPWLNGIVETSISLSHGWFEKERYVENPLLHQKFLYLKVNVGRFSGIGGVVHNSQWSGYEPDRGKLPRSFRDYLRVFFAQSADPNSNANPGEVMNVIGNSIAAYDFGLLYRGDSFEASITRMFYLEDKVSTRFRSPWDGVWGVNVEGENKNRILHTFIYEHINTKNQDAKSWELIGRRNYYGHYMYQSGWTYHGRTIGIPLILYEDGQITNNVLVGHHLGVSGQLTERLQYHLNISYSRNYGIQDDWVDEPGESIPNDREDIVPLSEFRKDQYSWLLATSFRPDLEYPLELLLQIAGDEGALYKDSRGLMIGLRMKL